MTGQIMTKLSLNNSIKDTQKVGHAMPNMNWTIHHRLTELFEEVGELANAIQTTEGFKSRNRQKSEIIDSVCDVLFEVFMIAGHYKIDLDEEYPKVLKHLDDRRKSGDFDHKK